MPNNSTAAMEVAVKGIKDFRKEIDACIQTSEFYLNAPAKMQGAREMALVRTKLQEAEMWAGKILEVWGTPFPPELADKAESAGETKVQ